VVVPFCARVRESLKIRSSIVWQNADVEQQPVEVDADEALQEVVEVLEVAHEVVHEVSSILIPPGSSSYTRASI
jgi:hypothetical protein